MQTSSGSRRRVYSSSGILYNSSSFFPLSSTRNAVTTTSTPRFHGPPPLFSIRLVFDPLRRRERRLGDNGSHQASGINYARLSPREKLRPDSKLELVAHGDSDEEEKLSAKYFARWVFCLRKCVASVNSRSHLAILTPILTFANFSADLIRIFVKCWISLKSRITAIDIESAII